MRLDGEQSTEGPLLRKVTSIKVLAHLICMCNTFAMFAASPSPTRAASIVGDGKAAHIAKTFAYTVDTYQMRPYFYTLSIYDALRGYKEPFQN